MRLSEMLKNYREVHSISMDKFAQDSGLSKAYISMIENEKNPQTGKPIVPSLLTLKKIAKGMHTNVDALINTADDMPVDISSDKRSYKERILTSHFNLLNDSGKDKAIDYVKLLTKDEENLKDTSSQSV